MKVRCGKCGSVLQRLWTTIHLLSFELPWWREVEGFGWCPVCLNVQSFDKQATALSPAFEEEADQPQPQNGGKP